MKVIPMTLKEANKVVGQHHRHNRPTAGGKFAIGAEHDGKVVGAVIVGRPIARLLDANGSAEITRLVVTDEAPRNTCSFLYAAARRVWQAMGGKKILTYTLQAESGDSLRGAGWQKAAMCRPSTWQRPNRSRGHQDVYRHPKQRWEAVL